MPGEFPGVTAVAGTYRLFGLTVDSQVPLEELPPGSAASPADVRIVPGAPGPVEGVRGISRVGGSLLLNLPGLARFTVTGGAEILVEAEPDASARNVRLYLLGSVFGALLHQRGLLPLHANAIDIGGRAVAFVGPSGAGKSTIAAWFHDRGHRVLADDVCAVAFVDGVPLAYPGLPRLRLWRDALEVRGRDAGDYHRSFDEMDKYDVPTGTGGGDAIPLAAVYRLGRADAGDIRKLSGVDAVDVLVANTYRGNYLPAIGGVARHLATCVALARSVPVFAANRVWGYDRLDAEAERLHAHALDLTQASFETDRTRAFA